MKEKTISEEGKFRILQAASGMYLTETIPDNWDELEEEERNQILEDFAWEPFDYHGTSYVWEKIESAAELIEEQIKKHAFANSSN